MLSPPAGRWGPRCGNPEIPSHGAPSRLQMCRRPGTRVLLAPVPSHSSPASKRTSYASSLSLHSDAALGFLRSLKKRRFAFLMPQGHRRRLQRLLRPLLGHSLRTSRRRRSSKWPRVSAQGGCRLLRPRRAPGGARLPGAALPAPLL